MIIRPAGLMREIRASILSGREESITSHGTILSPSKNGARVRSPGGRSIQTKIEDPISEKMLDGSLKSGDHLICGFEDGKFTFRTE